MLVDHLVGNHSHSKRCPVPLDAGEEKLTLLRGQLLAVSNQAQPGWPILQGQDDRCSYYWTSQRPATGLVDASDEKDFRLDSIKKDELP